MGNLVPSLLFLYLQAEGFCAGRVFSGLLRKTPPRVFRRPILFFSRSPLFPFFGTAATRGASFLLHVLIFSSCDSCSQTFVLVEVNLTYDPFLRHPPAGERSFAKSFLLLFGVCVLLEQNTSCRFWFMIPPDCPRRRKSRTRPSEIVFVWI